MHYLNSISLSEEEQAQFDEYLSFVSFQKGNCIMSEGDPGDGCYFIDEGRVRLELSSAPARSDIVIGFLDAGSSLGEFSLIDEQPRSANAFEMGVNFAPKPSTRSVLKTLCWAED